MFAQKPKAMANEIRGGRTLLMSKDPQSYHPSMGRPPSTYAQSRFLRAAVTVGDRWELKVDSRRVRDLLCTWIECRSELAKGKVIQVVMILWRSVVDRAS
jgi:hypothetical protein